ncbi:DUF3696 domain-containing protein [Methylomonas sp. AM2-LC]|uniref:AAA family ATPase n=1 Tax=Methylomonas sp. AM2-LC TaxID=3153301 RepID=UPI003267727B
MIEFISIKRFKTLLEASFPLSALNVYSGLNGMGKSSVIQTLLLLRQSQERNTLIPKGLLLNGDYIQLGTGRDALSIASEEENIEIFIKWEDFEFPEQFKFDYQSDSDLLPNSHITNHTHPPLIFYPELSLFNHNFHYLCAERLGPKSHHALSDFHIKDLNSLGNHGEYTVHFIAAHGSRNLSITALKHGNALSSTLLENIEAWMSEITPGLRIKAAAMPEYNSATLSYSFVQGKDVTADFKPQNVGFGLSYVLPVVTCILSAKPGDLLIIENPESHLHPAGQSVMGRLCALAAASGRVQIIVESHSDHFLNGVRVAIKESLISKDLVKLFFLQRSATCFNHESEVLYPSIDNQGRIDQWPDGFFDEWDKQLDRLL